MPLVYIAIGIAILFVLIIGFKLNSFLSLIIVAAIVGVMEGLPITKIMTSIEGGVGGTLGHLAIVLSLGAMLGKLMTDSGAAQRIATTLIDNFGRKRVKWAVVLTGFLVGIALFYEVGFVLLIPLIFTIVREADVPILDVGVPMAAALSVTHGFLPPHPGPTAIAGIYNADLGIILLYGIILAIPTVIVAGPVYSRFLKNIRPEIPEGLSTTKIFKEEEMPSFAVSILTAMIPVFLMAIAAITKLSFSEKSTVNVFFGLIGNADVALFIAVFVAIFTFGLNQGKKIKEVMTTIEKSAATIAMILLVVGGGGAFKQVLVDSGVGDYIIKLMGHSTMSPLFLAWLVAAVLRVSVGSATVAALTAAGIVAPLIAASGVSPELAVIATGSGSLILGPVNDAGFWMFKEFFNLSVKETLLSWSVLETIISIMGLIGVMALSTVI